MIYPDRVVESGVCRTGIDQVRESELFDIPLPLERRGVDDTNRRGVEPNRVPEGVADDPLFTVGRHVRRLAGPDWLGQWLFAPARSILTERLTERKAKVEPGRVHATSTKNFQAPVPTSALREYVRTHAENRPGVYQMLGADGNPLYVGKSIRVRTRLLSYFRAPAGEKAARLIRETGRIRWEYIPNEFSTLVREMRLIQRWQPRFNRQHKRKADVCLRETHARTRTPDPARHAGRSRWISLLRDPFQPSGRWAARFVIWLTLWASGIAPGPHRCFSTINSKSSARDGRPLCMRAELGTCLAPCCGGTSSEAYRRQVATARRFLEGQTRAPLAVLEGHIRGAVARLDFGIRRTGQGPDRTPPGLPGTSRGVPRPH